MEEQIGVEFRILVPQRLGGHLARMQRRRMAQGAADGVEQCPAQDDGRIVRRRRWWRQEAHEDRELDYVAGSIDGIRGIEVRRILWRRIKQATWRLVPLLPEHIVGHTLLDVVSFGGEEFERLVLGFPAKPRDRPVVAARVGPTLNTQKLFEQTVGLHVCEDRVIVDGFDQSGPEDRSGNPEDQVLAGGGALEVRLRE